MLRFHAIEDARKAIQKLKEVWPKPGYEFELYYHTGSTSPYVVKGSAKFVVTASYDHCAIVIQNTYDRRVLVLTSKCIPQTEILDGLEMREWDYTKRETQKPTIDDTDVLNNPELAELRKEWWEICGRLK